jgi:Flp pilus assembly protein TadB/Mg-chelatase subunit ChlD
MTRRAAFSLFLAVAALLAAAACAEAASPMALTESGRANFPSRAYVLSLPQGRLARPQQVHVTENGRRVSGVSVVPASAVSARGFGVVLVIDTSRSMKGAPIRDAMAAARAFAARRDPNQRLGVVTFNGQASVALPLTQDSRAIARVLAKPPLLGKNTHVFDAVDTAVRMLAVARLKPASVVVLSDGSDTGSRIGSAAVSADARKRGVRIFSVGLRSGAFDPDALAGLARATHGIYNTANSPRDLARIYDTLGARLANEYLISYRSLAGPNARIRVGVRVEGVPGAAGAEYTTPRLRTTVPPYTVSNFWSSAAAQLLVSLMIGLLVVATVYFTFSRPGRRNLRRRMSHFITPEAPEPEPERSGAPMAASAGMLAKVGASFERAGWWPAFAEELDVARIEMQAKEVAGATVVGTLLMVFLLAMATGSFLIGSIALLIPLGVRRFLKFKVQRERRHFTDQLADNLQVISSALRAGYSLVGAMSVAVDDSPQPTKREFGRVVADEKLGVPLDEGLSVVARRMQNRDLEQVMLVASLQRETGGNTAEVLDRVADTVRERAELRRMILTLTAQGRISRWVVTALPVVLALAITTINPSYLEPLFKTGLGHAALVLAAFLLIGGSLAIKKIVTIEV